MIHYITNTDFCGYGDVQRKIKEVSNDIGKLIRCQHDQEQQAILDWLTQFHYAAQQSDYINLRQNVVGLRSIPDIDPSTNLRLATLLAHNVANWMDRQPPALRRHERAPAFVFELYIKAYSLIMECFRPFIKSQLESHNTLQMESQHEGKTLLASSQL